MAAYHSLARVAAAVALLAACPAHAQSLPPSPGWAAAMPSGPTHAARSPRPTRSTSRATPISGPGRWSTCTTAGSPPRQSTELV